MRADAGFAVPALYEYCEEEGVAYTVGLITNPRLEELAEDLCSARPRNSTRRPGAASRGSSMRLPTRREAGGAPEEPSTRPRR